MYAVSSTVALALEMFLSGATSAISLYCGTKLPRNRRK